MAPARDLITVAKSVGTAAVLSGNRVRLGVGVGWCREEFEQTGQDFANRGRRLDEMIPALRALWAGGWVEYHGDYYDVPACQMNPSPGRPRADPGRRPLRARRCVGRRPCATAGSPPGPTRPRTRPGPTWPSCEAELERAGRAGEPFDVYLSLAERPDVDLYRRFEEAGVTDMVCAPWMCVPPGHRGRPRCRSWRRGSAPASGSPSRSWPSCA